MAANKHSLWLSTPQVYRPPTFSFYKIKSNTSQQFYDHIFILLGYKYSYPFLSVDSGIFIDDNFVEPLYKQIINIEHPTMAFIGIPSSAPNFHMFDLQVN